MPVSASEFSAVVREFLLDLRGDIKPARKLGDQDDLFELGHLDSLSFLRLIVHLEKRFRGQIPIKAGSLNNLRSVKDLYASFVAERE